MKTELVKPRENQKIIVRKNGSIRIQSLNTEPSLTQQQFKESCDINNIIKNYHQTGELPLSNKVGKFLDVSNIQDYQSSLHTIMEAENAFIQLPSNIRSRFENDPQKLVSFLNDRKNIEEAITLGLVEKPKQNDEPKPKQNDESKQPIT